MGGSWVLRNDQGVVLLHSRRAFSGLSNKDEANFEILKWAVESMKSHQMARVVFYTESDVMIGAITRPEAWQWRIC